MERTPHLTESVCINKCLLTCQLSSERPCSTLLNLKGLPSEFSTFNVKKCKTTHFCGFATGKQCDLLAPEWE